MGSRSESLHRHTEKVEALPEQDKKNLKEYADFLNQLKSFIMAGLRPIYAELLDLQKGGASPGELKQVGSQLENKMTQFVKQNFPEFIFSDQAAQLLNKKLPQPIDLVKSLDAEIIVTSSIQLDDNPLNNPFRISLWLEKNSSLQTSIAKIAK